MGTATLGLSDIRQAFVDEGLSVTEWADRHGFPRGSVYAVLSGRCQGRRGQAHRIAVALGLKASHTSMLTENVTSPASPVFVDGTSTLVAAEEDAPMS